MAESESSGDGAKGSTGVRASLSLLRRNRDFRRLYFAQIISFGGDWFTWVAIASLVLELTGSVMTLALSVVVQELPFFLISPLGGALADRLDRRKLMVITDLSRAVLCLGFLFVGSTDTLWIAFIILGAISGLAAIFDPAASAAVPNLVDNEDLATANSLAGSAWGTMLAVGAAIGGLVVATMGRDVAFVADAASFAASAALLWGIRRSFSEERSHEEHPGVLEATRETIRYAREDHRVLAFLSVKAGFGIAGGVIVLVSFYATNVFHAGDVGIGVLMAARGVGALVGPFVGRWYAGSDDRRLFPAIGIALVVFGVSYAALGFAPSLLLGAVAICCAHLGGGTQWALSTYGLQKTTQDHIRGRVFAVDYALITLSFTFSSLIAGVCAEAFGPRWTAVGLGATAVCWAGTWWFTTKRVRSLPL
jgi:MFS family permease